MKFKDKVINMWLLINVNDVTDVGNNENKRYLLSDHISIVTPPGSITTAIVGLGTIVHPATEKDMIDEIWGDGDDTL